MKKVMDIIDLQSYEAGYSTGYSEAELIGYDTGYRAGLLDYKKRIKEWKQRRLYFLKQKAIGVFLLVFTVFATKALEGDATMAILTLPLGLALIFGKYGEGGDDETA